MGECFHEYSKHHGEVLRAGDTMDAKAVVDKIYGMLIDGNDIGTTDVFLDLLEQENPSYNDLNKLCRNSDATPEELKEQRLYIRGDGFELGTWDNEKRIAYIQQRIDGDEDALTNLDKLQFLRYRFEKGKSIQDYLERWEVDDALRDLCEGLADATGDETYLRILGADSTLEEF